MMQTQDRNTKELAPFVCDNLHFNAQEVDSYNKPFNYIVCEREAGKSVLLWKKVYNAFRSYLCPSIILKRQIIDITDQFIEDIARLLKKFTGQDIVFKYKKQDIKQGQMDLFINGHIFVRLIALSCPMSRLKSMMLPNVRYIMFDEFICNLRMGEKYLQDEPMRVKELFTTYNRESEKGIKCYFFGNPYSLYNPYFSWLNVDTSKLYPSAIISKDEYVIHCYQIKPELKEKILEKNPLYKFDDSYKSYAFDGRAVQDINIRIMKEQPKGFRLFYCFKLNNRIVGIYRGYSQEDNLHYWARKMSENELSQKRDIVCFDFGQMANKTILLNNNGKKLYSFLKQSIENRSIAYQDIESSYLIEEIYQEI